MHHHTWLNMNCFILLLKNKHDGNFPDTLTSQLFFDFRSLLRPLRWSFVAYTGLELCVEQDDLVLLILLPLGAGILSCILSGYCSLIY